MLIARVQHALHRVAAVSTTVVERLRAHDRFDLAGAVAGVVVVIIIAVSGAAVLVGYLLPAPMHASTLTREDMHAHTHPAYETGRYVDVDAELAVYPRIVLAALLHHDMPLPDSTCVTNVRVKLRSIVPQKKPKASKR